MRVLMVHGRAQGGKLADDLLAIWVETLREGFAAATKVWPEKVEFDFPYYADELDRFAALKNLPTPTDVVAKGTGQNQEFEQFLQSALGEIKNNAAISDEEVRQHMDPTAPQEKGVQNWNWVQAIARAIDTRLTAASLFTIEKFLRDVFVYVNHRDVERKINAIVEAKLTAEPTLVIAHSLGSVVAYKVILRNRAKLNLRKFITVGSPLGLKAISSKLGVPENPGGENGWYNAYDERDVVALNPLDEVYFRTSPVIVNNNKVKNMTDNRHGIIGYLNDPEVATQIASGLT